MRHLISNDKTKLLLWIVAAFAFLWIVAVMIHKARKEQNLYVVFGVVETVNALNEDLSFLQTHFHGDVTTLSSSIETVILKPGYTLLDMLWMGETTVQTKWAREYQNLNLALANDYVHIHQTPEQIHYVLAGIEVKGFNLQSQGVVLQLTHVQRDLVQLLEAELGSKLSHFPSTIAGTRDVSIRVLDASPG